MEKLIINKSMQPGETSKIEKYSKIVNTLIEKAKELNVDSIYLSAEFTPILRFADLAVEPSPFIFGEYLFGTKDGIKFIISPKYANGGSVGDTEIVLATETEGN